MAKINILMFKLYYKYFNILMMVYHLKSVQTFIVFIIRTYRYNTSSIFLSLNKLLYIRICVITIIAWGFIEFTSIFREIIKKNTKISHTNVN